MAATSIDFTIEGVIVEKTESSHIFRLRFPKAIVLRLVDFETRELVTERPLPFITVQLSEKDARALRILSSLNRFDAVSLKNFEKERDRLYLAIRENSIEELEKKWGESGIPSLYFFRSISFRISLGNVQTFFSPIEVPYLRAKFSPFINHKGTYSRTSVSSGSLENLEAVSRKLFEVQDFLKLSQSVREGVEKIRRQMLRDAELMETPLADVIEFPTCRKSLRRLSI